MMLNKAPAHLKTLGNNIYTKKKFLKNIFLFIMNNRNTRKKSEICSKSIKKTPKLSTYFTPFSSVSTGTYFTPFFSVSTADFG